MAGWEMGPFQGGGSGSFEAWSRGACGSKIRSTRTMKNARPHPLPHLRNCAQRVVRRVPLHFSIGRLVSMTVLAIEGSRYPSARLDPSRQLVPATEQSVEIGTDRVP